MKAQDLKLGLAALVVAASLAHPARAATLSVTSLADSGFGTLRQQIANAANGDTIIFRDVNNDGITDLVLSFDLNHALQGQVCEAVTQLDLTGQILSNQLIFGAVQVEAVAR